MDERASGSIDSILPATIRKSRPAGPAACGTQRGGNGVSLAGRIPAAFIRRKRLALRQREAPAVGALRQLLLQRQAGKAR